MVSGTAKYFLRQFDSILFHRHQAREAEPKDYDISRGNERNLCKATYDRIGNITDGVSLLRKR